MSVDFSYLVPVLLGLCVIVAVACVFMLQRYAKRLDQGSLEKCYSGSSQSDGNPYQPPSELELQEQLHGSECGQGKDRQLKVRVALPSMCVLIAVAVGVVSCLCRPIAHIGGVHYEMIVALFILISLALFLVYLNHPARHALPHLFFQLENLSLWLAFALGWTLANRGLWDDLIVLTVFALVFSAAVGIVLLAGLGRLKRSFSTS